VKDAHSRRADVTETRNAARAGGSADRASSMMSWMLRSARVVEAAPLVCAAGMSAVAIGAPSLE
jgi:hypothetical protein